MLAGAVLGPVGALAGAVGGAIAGSRAGAAASEGRRRLRQYHCTETIPFITL